MARWHSYPRKQYWVQAAAYLETHWPPTALLFVALTICLIVPASIAYNIDLKSMLVVSSGLISWLTIGLNWRKFYRAYSQTWWPLIGTFVFAILCSTLLNHSTNANIFGTPLVRLGSLEIVACIGIAVCLGKLAVKQIVQWLYGSIVLVAVTTVPYSYYLYGGFGRPGGVYYQADILAIILGCGWLLGFEVLRDATRRRYWLYASQALLLAVLLVTQTRAAIVITLLLTIIRFVVVKRPSIKYLLLLALCLGVAVVALAQVFPSRLTSPAFANESTSYRLSLQSAGLAASRHKPLLGYGPSGIETALSCQTLHSPALLQTCRNGYFFDSSHNIFLDRVLAFGWPAGLMFLLVVLGSTYKSLCQQQITAFTYCVLAIAAYYLTNVTNVELELLLWIVLIRAYASPPAKNDVQ